MRPEDIAETTAPELAAPIEVEVAPNTVLELPAGASPETIRTAIRNFRATSLFDRLIDKTTGTPAFVRAQVGSAPEADRMANIRRFYPDAVPYDEDNFVFTNPATGRPTLYNPPGLDWGDVPAVGREITQAVFSGAGAALGAAGGFVVGAVAGPPGMMAAAGAGAVMGAGLGSAAGGSLWDISANLIGGRIDTRTTLEASIDTALDFGGGAVGQRFGELLEQGIRAGAGATRTGVQRMVEAYQRVGVEPPAGAVTGSRALGNVEQMLGRTPSSASIMQENARRVIDQTRAAAARLAERFGPVQTITGAGETIRRAAVRAVERFGFKQEEIYTEVFDLIGADTLVQVNAVAALRQELLQELATAPRALRQPLQRALRMLTSIEDDAAGGGIAFSALRQVRTNIGRDVGSPTMFTTSSQNANMRRVYGALTEDLSAAAARTSADAAQKLRVADRFTRIFMNTAAETLEKISRFDADEKAFNYVMARTQDGANLLARLRRNFTDDEWDTVAGTVLGRLGRATPGAQNTAGDAFSVSTFLTNWNRMTLEARSVVFGGPRYRELAPALDDLVSVVGSLKEMERLANTSNTSNVMIAYMTMQGLLGGLVGTAATGSTTGGAGVAATTIIGPNLAARLITSPSFVRWLTRPVTNPNGIAAHMGRLLAIAEAEPEIRDDIHAYLRRLGVSMSEDQEAVNPEPR